MLRSQATLMAFPLAGRPSLRRMGLSLALLGATAFAAVQLKPYFGETSSALVFVLGVTVIGAWSGIVPALVCAVVGSVIFNFFIAEPVLMFRIASGADLAPPVMFTLCAVISGALSGQLKDQTYRTSQSNLRLQSLLEVSRNLQQANDEEEVYDALQQSVPALIGVELALYRLDAGAPAPVGHSPDGEPWLAAARMTATNHAEWMRHEGLIAYRLAGSQRVSGVMVTQESPIDEILKPFMLALARVLGLALERVELARTVSDIRAQAQAEEMKSTLLSSVSHDLRTPLTAIGTSASSLLDYGDRFDDATRRQLLSGIIDECGHLDHLTANLLEMSRLQHGAALLRASVFPAPEVVRAVVARMKRSAGKRAIIVAGTREEQLVEADPTLFELALANVCQNAIRYSPDASTIHVSCDGEDGWCVITVEDEGLGVPEADRERVFERFYRVMRDTSAPKGTGLGLAIAKGFVEASGGTIALVSPVQGDRGTLVTIRLPLAPEYVGA